MTCEPVANVSSMDHEAQSSVFNGENTAEMPIASYYAFANTVSS